MITTPPGPRTEAGSAEPLTLRLGHPVRNFTLVLLALAAPLLAAWWTGAVTPRLRLGEARTAFDRCTRQASFAFEVSNPTPFAVTLGVVRVTVAGTGSTDDRSLFSAESADPGTPVRLGPGDHRRVLVRSRIVERQAERTNKVRAPAQLEMTARTVLGLNRTLTDRTSLSFDLDTGEGPAGTCPPG